MPEEPNQPLAPRPVIPIEQPTGSEAPAPPRDEIIDAQIVEGPPAEMPVAEPGTPPPAPFAQIYVPPSIPAPPVYYPPPYPAPGAAPVAPAGGYAPPPFPGAYPPWPTAPVDYYTQMARSHSRPGIITALAVTAMIAAGVSIIACLFSGCTSSVIMNNARKAGASRIVSAVPSPVVTTPAAQTSANALTEGDRIAVITALRQKRAFSEERARQLQAFLLEHGRVVFDDSNGGMTAQSVAKCISEAGQEFATGGKTRPEFFVFKSVTPCKLAGRLRLFDDHVLYRPDDYSPDLRSAAKSGSDLTAPSTPATPAPPVAAGPVGSGLEDDQVAALVGHAQRLSSNRLNEAQANALAALLQGPTYAYYLQDASTIPGLTAQLKSAAVTSDGSVTMTFNMGQLVLDAQGNRASALPAAAAAPTTQGIAPATPMWTMGSLVVDQSSCSLGLVEAILSGLLAIYLLVIAILTLRQNPIGKRYYFIYVVVKVGLGVMAIVAFNGILSSLKSGGASIAGVPSMAQGYEEWFKTISSAALTFAVIGLAYPLIVLLVLTLNRTAREFYKSGN